VLLRPRFLVPAALVAVVGLSVNLFIPIRAQLDPYMNQGDATNWPALHAVLTREQFAKPSIFDNPMYERGSANPGRSIVLIGQQFLNYWQYFTWQFGRDWSALAERLLAVLFTGLGFLGARRHWRADRRSALAMTTLVLTLTVALVFYLNFKWGYSQPYTGSSTRCVSATISSSRRSRRGASGSGSAWRRSPKRSSRDCHKRDGASPPRCSSSR